MDASFIYLEDQATPMHVGGVAVFRRPRGGFDYDELVELIAHRLDLVPRYRQKVLTVPGHLARPVWADDPDFDLTYHVRRSALPRPGSDEQLHELVARLMSRPLDPSRPLWEAYLVEGLARGGSRWSPRRTWRWWTGSARSTSARSSSTRCRRSARSTRASGCRSGRRPRAG
ncbi:hypothetical protein GCM10029964_111090 [Kibdelosporangium lantanae]